MALERTRRSALASVGATAAAVLAGCAAFGDHPELLVLNHRDGPVTASISMRRVGEDAEAYAETFQLAADGDAQRQLDLAADQHRIATDVEGGPSRTSTWTPGDGGCCIEVHVEDDAVEHRVRSY